MLALGLYNSLIILLIGTFKLAGSTPDPSDTPYIDCSQMSRLAQERCCRYGRWISALPGCH
ncbi:hypothetical protein PGT21_020370 [Puccinia graminis f. sp. tritici]|uniref:Uncharacterized protein n=1 Tax=Puccinia graminis f. sp. tritici TaxID=56615 RepID=A0A5B0QAZ4_PUCGR|nr:hypothetical protein PGT21_020370 [Puccinia graminis f. sp. tritici]